jgi:hypothetical protein
VQTFDKLTEDVGGQRRIIEKPPIIVRETALPDGTPVTQAIDRILQSYRRSLPEDRRLLLSRYHVIDVVQKVVGVGSVGLSCWVIMLEGLDDDDPLFLQVKEARASVLAPYVKTRMQLHDHGERVVMGQRMIQGSPDIFLGWGPDEAGDARKGFYVRQLADMKGGVRYAPDAPDTLAGLPDHCGLCGWALALAHAKSGDPAMISGYCGLSDALPDAVSDFAMAYLDRTQSDHAALKAAIDAGRIVAVDA